MPFYKKKILRDAVGNKKKARLVGGPYIISQSTYPIGIYEIGNQGVLRALNEREFVS